MAQIRLRRSQRFMQPPASSADNNAAMVTMLYLLEINNQHGLQDSL